MGGVQRNIQVCLDLCILNTSQIVVTVLLLTFTISIILLGVSFYTVFLRRIYYLYVKVNFDTLNFSLK